MWENLKNFHQHDDGTRQIMKLAYQEAQKDKCLLQFLILQKEAGLLSWNKAGENKFAFVRHLADKLEIEVIWDPLNEYTIVSAQNITLATLTIKAKL